MWRKFQRGQNGQKGKKEEKQCASQKSLLSLSHTHAYQIRICRVIVVRPSTPHQPYKSPVSWKPPFPSQPHPLTPISCLNITPLSWN